MPANPQKLRASERALLEEWAHQGSIPSMSLGKDLRTGKTLYPAASPQFLASMAKRGYLKAGPHGADRGYVFTTKARRQLREAQRGGLTDEHMRILELGLSNLQLKPKVRTQAQTKKAGFYPKRTLDALVRKGWLVYIPHPEQPFYRTSEIGVDALSAGGSNHPNLLPTRKNAMKPKGHKRGCQCVICARPKRKSTKRRNHGYENTNRIMMREERAALTGTRARPSAKRKKKVTRRPNTSLRLMRNPEGDSAWWILDLYDTKGTVTSSIEQASEANAREAAQDAVGQNIMGKTISKAQLSGPYSAQPGPATERK